MKLNKQIFGWLGASALLLTTACSNEMPSEPQVDDQLHNINEVFGTGSSIINLTLNSETVLGTRADDDSHISDGSQVNTIYFEVYDLGTEGDNTTKIGDVTTTPNFINMTPVSVSKSDFPVTLRLAVDPEHNYRIAVWGQHTEPGTNGEIDKSPFDFSTLRNVTVKYENAKNNDELRDAFCATEFFEGGDKNVTVIMHRPFAQLNVGTTGADYKNYMKGNIIPNKTVKFSRMVVSDVCNTIDVANDIISGENKQTVTFEYNTIAAFWKGVPTPITALAGEKEEMLKVKLNADNSGINKDKDNDGFLDYKISYPTRTKDGTYLTETFRYMSMAYVLVETEDANPDWVASGDVNEHDKYTNTTLSKVEVYFAESDANKFEDGHKFFTVHNVPVHRNWRTNLIGGLYYTKEPTDPDDPDTDPDPDPDPDPEPGPEDPDDPSSLFYNTKIMVNLCPIYYGEFSGVYDEKQKDNWFGVTNENFPSGDDSLHGKYEKDPNAGTDNGDVDNDADAGEEEGDE